jgi:hypothetical protein
LIESTVAAASNRQPGRQSRYFRAVPIQLLGHCVAHWVIEVARICLTAPKLKDLLFESRILLAGTMMLSVSSVGLLLAAVVDAAYNGLAVTPQMGWVSILSRMKSFQTDVSRTIGTPLDAMYLKSYSSAQPRRSWNSV